MALSNCAESIPVFLWDSRMTQASPGLAGWYGRDQAPKPEPRILHYELSDYEWAAIKPMLPNNIWLRANEFAP